MSKRYTISRNQNNGYSIKDQNNQKASLNDIKSIFQNGGTASLTENNNLILHNSHNGLSRGIKKNVPIHPGSSLEDLKNSLIGGKLQLSEADKQAIKKQKGKIKTDRDAKQITYEQWLKGKEIKVEKEQEKRQQKGIKQKYAQFNPDELIQGANRLIIKMNEKLEKAVKFLIERSEYNNLSNTKKAEAIIELKKQFKQQNINNLKQLTEGKFSTVYGDAYQNKLYLYNEQLFNQMISKIYNDDDYDPFSDDAQPVKPQTGFFGKLKTTFGIDKKTKQVKRKKKSKKTRKKKKK